jgi:hypothetical protein
MAPFSGHMPTFDSMLRFAAGRPARLEGRARRQAKGRMIEARTDRELSVDGPVYLGIGRLCRWNAGRACANVE